MQQGVDDMGCCVRQRCRGVDEVRKSGTSKVSSADAGSNVAQFPFPVYTPPGGPGSREK